MSSLRQFVASLFASLRGRSAGQGLVEYGLIVVMVALVAVVGLFALGPAVRDLLSAASTSV